MFLFRFFARVYNLYFAADRALAHQVRDLVGFAPAKLALFRRAFAHKSGAHRDGAPVGNVAAANNERLEYLGDAVLGTIVAEFLFKKYPRADEGFLTKMRSKIVKRKSLNYIGEEMGLGIILRERNRLRLSSSMLGNAVEALVGAVYLERGYARTERFVIRRMLRPYLDLDALESTDDNYKSQLLEACQKQGKTITYALVKKFKQDRRDRFKVAVVIGGKEVAVADDFNKKSAEQQASLKALEKMGLADNLVVPRRKEKRSRADKRAARDEGTASAKTPAATTPNSTSRSSGAAVIVTAGDASAAPGHTAPPSVAKATKTKTARAKAKRRRSPYDYLVKHAVRTGAAGAAATEAVLGGRAGAKLPVAAGGLSPKPQTVQPTTASPLREIILAGAAGLAAAGADQGTQPNSERGRKRKAGATDGRKRRRVPAHVRHAVDVGATGVLIGKAAVEALASERGTSSTQAPSESTRDGETVSKIPTPTKPKRKRGAVAKRTLKRMVADGAAGVMAGEAAHETAHETAHENVGSDAYPLKPSPEGVGVQA